MNAELKREWIAALRSGEYQQARGTLHHKGAYCCLGVWCALNGYTVREDSNRDEEDCEIYSGTMIGPNGEEQPCDLLVKALEGEGVDLDTQDSVSAQNDDGRSFAEIADWIEKHIPEDAA